MRQPLIWAILALRASARLPPTLPKLRLDESVARFLVIAQPRSGSTWFAKYSAGLAGLDGVVTAGEVMHPDHVAKVRRRGGEDPRESTAAYLR